MAKNLIPIAYSVGAGSSDTWAKAFAQGCGGRVLLGRASFRPAPLAMFPHLDNYHLMQHAIKEGWDYYFGDHAYFGRRVYYRITKNAPQITPYLGAKPDRFKKLNVEIKPWRKGGRVVLICQQSEDFFKMRQLSRSAWLSATIAKIKQHTDREILVRSKMGGDSTERAFRNSLQGVYAVVVHSSVAGVQAALEGVPCFATEPCASASFGLTDLSKIESPRYPDDREELAWSLADNQWTMEEIKMGEAWERLR